MHHSSNEGCLPYCCSMAPQTYAHRRCPRGMLCFYTLLSLFLRTSWEQMFNSKGLCYSRPTFLSYQLIPPSFLSCSFFFLIIYHVTPPFLLSFAHHNWHVCSTVWYFQYTSVMCNKQTKVISILLPQTLATSFYCWCSKPSLLATLESIVNSRNS